MDPLKLGTVARLSGGILSQGDESILVSSVTTDSRTLAAGSLFVALKGENFDGHSFVEAAAAAGAAGALVEKGFAGTVPPGFALIRVEDTLAGLQRLAAGYRRTLTLRVVGVTGSSGKTSTKDMILAVLARKLKVTGTTGNLNNHIGVPLSILAANSSHEAAVYEMGMNHRGEIAPLAAIAAPEVGVISNIGTAHIEHLGSRTEIAREKGDLIEALPKHGAAVLPAEDDFVEHLQRRCHGRVLLAGLAQGGIRAENIAPRAGGSEFELVEGSARVPALLPVPGVHMVKNAVLAVAVGRWFDVPLEDCAKALSEVSLAKGRLQRREADGVVILDDTYNANPDSTAAALETLGAMPCEGRHIAVLGPMKELGPEAESGHRFVGEVAARMASVLVAVGEESTWTADSALSANPDLEVIRVNTPAEAGAALRNLARPGDVVLVKGSRSAKMEGAIETFAGGRT